MKLNRNEHSRFIQWLDRTAEKNLLLWLPCVLIITLALTVDHIAEYAQIVYLHRNTEKVVKEKPQLERKPFALRFVAMSLVVAFGFMFTADLGQAVYADEYHDFENSGITINADLFENSFDGDFNSEQGNNDNSLSFEATENTDETNIKAYSDSNAVYDDFTYKISNGEVTITGYNGVDTAVIIPNTIEGLPVSIGYGAFYNCRSLTSIKIPNCVTFIGPSAFSYCTSLTSIAISDSVTYIGSSALYGCRRLTIYCDDSSCARQYAKDHEIAFKDINEFNGNNELEKNKCGENAYWELSSEGILTVTGTGAIYDYDYNVDDLTSNEPRQNNTVKKAIISDGITEIGNDFLMYCTELDTIELPQSLTRIGEAAFAYTKLTNIVIPNSVNSIEDYAFEG